MIRIGLIEDVLAIRAGQEKYLTATGEFEVVISAGSVEEFQVMLDAYPHTLDVVVSDIGLPGMSGIEGVMWTKAKSPQTEVIMVSVYTDADNIYKALCAGAVGYLAKNTPLNELRDAIMVVREGGSPMTPSIARKVINHFAPQKANPDNELSSKELQVVQCVVEGLSYKLIADRMSISINTVRHHIRNIYGKLQINSKAELIKKSYGGELGSLVA